LFGVGSADPATLAGPPRSWRWSRSSRATSRRQATRVDPLMAFKSE